MQRLRVIGLAFVMTALLAPRVVQGQVPETSMEIDAERTALVITDPQNDFLHPEGAAWGAVGESVRENRTIEHLESLLRTAREAGIPVFVSPHYYYPHDQGWAFEGALEVLMHEIEMFDRAGPLRLEGFEGSGADWLARLEPYIEGPGTTVVNPHKLYGPEQNDLVLQLRKEGIDRVILAGMSANLCVEAHLRELLEQGFEVGVVKDGTAAAKFPGLDGYEAAVTNFRFIANEVFTTEDVTRRIRRASGS